MTELLVGSRKGLFVLEGEPGAQFEVSARAFAGEPVDFAMRDPRSGRLLATLQFRVGDSPELTQARLWWLALDARGQPAVDRWVSV